MKHFARDGSHKSEPLHIHSEDEIGEIAASYEKMTKDISDYIGSIESLTKDKIENDVQLTIARHIQYGMVPKNTSLSGNGYCISAMTRPARSVGGDFYDCFRREDHKVCVVMGDVSGKGVSAAIFMAMAKTMIREKLMTDISPAKALNQTNDALCAQNPEALFATVFAAVLDPLTGELLYANAGHTNPVLLGKSCTLLKPDPGIILGLFEDAGLTNQVLSLATSEGLLLYTDGVTEAINPQKQFFGEDRLVDAVNSIRDRDNPEEVILGVSRAVDEFSDGNEAFDDMALLALVLRPAKSPRQIKIPLALASFDILKNVVFETAGDTPETRRALLACDEALSNIVNYSGATELSFCFALKPT